MSSSPNFNLVMNHRTVPGKNRMNARKMRKTLTGAELKLWNELRAHRLMGLGFRRQMPVANFIVDFACAEHRLVIELDGAGHSHDAHIIRDARRDRQLSDWGWTVLRFTNDDVLFRLDEVCSHIIRAIGVDTFDRV